MAKKKEKQFDLSLDYKYESTYNVFVKILSAVNSICKDMEKKLNPGESMILKGFDIRLDIDKPKKKKKKKK
jgi:hypothetical protein